jgi:hypothetical protein
MTAPLPLPVKKLRKKLREGWSLFRELFGDFGVDIYDLEMENYNYFLDHVKSLAKLISGLEELSPLADDALEVATQMSEQEFYDFKRALARERGLSERDETGTTLSPAYMRLVLPDRFLTALLIASEANVALGVALIRLIEHEFGE